jgi:hypothetical protein
MHGSVMKGAAIDPRDKDVMGDAKYYGIGHGDINISNFFYMAPAAGEEYGHLDVFDWDQVCFGGRVSRRMVHCGAVFACHSYTGLFLRHCVRHFVSI